MIGLLAIAAIPTTIGVGQAVSAQKRQNEAAKEKAKFHLTATLSIDGGPPTEAWVVLTDNQLTIDHPDAPRPAHKFTGYYFTYPSEAQHRGLVSTIADDPPMLNWIYADKDTSAVKYGGRKDTLEHTIGPWGWSSDEQFLTLEGDDSRFIAVEEGEDEENRKWTVYLATDRDDLSETAASTEGPRDDVRQSHRWAPIKLRRRMQLGMESRYVKGEKE